MHILLLCTLFGKRRRLLCPALATLKFSTTFSPYFLTYTLEDTKRKHTLSAHLLILASESLPPPSHLAIIVDTYAYTLSFPAPRLLTHFSLESFASHEPFFHDLVRRTSVVRRRHGTTTLLAIVVSYLVREGMQDRERREGGRHG